MRLIKTGSKFDENSINIPEKYAELGHIQYYRRKYSKSAYFYSQALFSTIIDLDQQISTMNKLKRIKKSAGINYNLIYYRFCMSLINLKENIWAALILQMEHKTPYKLIFEILQKHDWKVRKDGILKLFYKMQIVELLICEFHKKNMFGEENELMKRIENEDLFKANPKHRKKQLKQNCQIQLITILKEYFDNY